MTSEVAATNQPAQPNQGEPTAQVEQPPKHDTPSAQPVPLQVVQPPPPPRAQVSQFRKSAGLDRAQASAQQLTDVDDDDDAVPSAPPARRETTRRAAAPRQGAQRDRTQRTVMEKFKSAQDAQGVDRALELMVERGQLSPEALRAHRLQLAAKEQGPARSAAAAPTQAPAAQSAEGAQPPPKPAEPARFMGQPVSRLAPFEDAASAIAAALVNASKGGLVDLSKKAKVKLYQGTDAEKEIDTDPTGRLASLLAASMAKRMPLGDGAGDDPDKELLAWVLPLAGPLTRAYGGKVLAVGGVVLSGVGAAFRGAMRMLKGRGR